MDMRSDCGKNPGHKGGDDAVSIGHAGAHADQREHVGAAIDERSPEALEERQAAPEDDGRGQGEFDSGQNRAPRSDHVLDASRTSSPPMKACQKHGSHGDCHQRRGEGQADPEAAGHVAQFGISSSSAVTVRGSSAMPQMGHEPGSERTISGCMGQVYSVRVGATGTSGSSAMPQEGQGPGLLAWTSGHMGQT
jgi:hypothetical protein